jgi:hypothetical protein
MKTVILAALIAVSAIATGTVANADTFAVHGYLGNSYGN